jgi:hypothetical protein
MSERNVILKTTSMLLTGILASSILAFQVGAQSAASTAAQPPSAPNTASAARALVGPAARPVANQHGNQQLRLPRRVQAYYGVVWGVDDLSVKAAESGEIIRFSWRVVDPDLAKTIHDKNLEPSLIDPQAGVKLVVPALEQVGVLRQMSTPIAGKSYWMAFSNPGRMVKPGHRIIVQIGPFHADGLIVE